ncbi:MAG: molybdenum cofactor biosynthesis protein MoaE [bacterium JZ-2024 1]
MAQIVREPIDPGVWYQQLVSEDCGAVVFFVGTVRNENEGLRVSGVDYEGYEPLAQKRLQAIEHEIRKKWQVRKVILVHRLGALKLGEASVVVGVSAPHRDEAFAAAEYGIRRIKEAVPIWKRELTEEGPRWLSGQTMKSTGENAD